MHLSPLEQTQSKLYPTVPRNGCPLLPKFEAVVELKIFSLSSSSSVQCLSIGFEMIRASFKLSYQPRFSSQHRRWRRIHFYTLTLRLAIEPTIAMPTSTITAIKTALENRNMIFHNPPLFLNWSPFDVSV